MLKIIKPLVFSSLIIIQALFGLLMISPALASDHDGGGESSGYHYGGDGGGGGGDGDGGNIPEVEVNPEEDIAPTGFKSSKRRFGVNKSPAAQDRIFLEIAPTKLRVRTVNTSAQLEADRALLKKELREELRLQVKLLNIDLQAANNKYQAFGDVLRSASKAVQLNPEADIGYVKFFPPGALERLDKIYGPRVKASKEELKMAREKFYKNKARLTKAYIDKLKAGRQALFKAYIDKLNARKNQPKAIQTKPTVVEKRPDPVVVEEKLDPITPEPVTNVVEADPEPATPVPVMNVVEADPEPATPVPVAGGTDELDGFTTETVTVDGEYGPYTYERLIPDEVDWWDDVEQTPAGLVNPQIWALQTGTPPPNSMDVTEEGEDKIFASYQSDKYLYTVDQRKKWANYWGELGGKRAQEHLDDADFYDAALKTAETVKTTAEYSAIAISAFIPVAQLETVAMKSFAIGVEVAGSIAGGYDTYVKALASGQSERQAQVAGFGNVLSARAINKLKSVFGKVSDAYGSYAEAVSRDKGLFTKTFNEAFGNTVKAGMGSVAQAVGQDGGSAIDKAVSANTSR
jgi:hypothetical protein